MLKINSFFKITLAASLFFSCAPKPGSNLRDKLNQQQAPELIFSAPAKPTVNLNDLQKDPATPYQLPANKVLTKDKKEVILGSSQILNATVQYSSKDKKMLIIGDVNILDDKKQKIAAKSFSLIGYHQEKETSFGLYDENDAKDKNLIVRAQVNCIGLNAHSMNDCSHVIIDVYVQHNNQHYTEQIEADNKGETNNSVPPEQKIPTKPNEQSNPPAPINTQPPVSGQEDSQSEESDDSIAGRYQGSIDTVDLTHLFNTPAPVGPPAPAPITNTPPVNSTPPETPPTEAPKPKDNTPPSENPPPKKDEQKTDTPTPKPPETPTPEAPKVTKKLSDDLVQTEEGLVRPYNQSIGFPDSGKLRNSTSMLNTQKLGDNNKFFQVVAPQREKHYATFEMAQMIIRTGKFMSEKYNKRLYVGNASLINGGKVNPHASHQIGVDIDLGYPTDAAGVLFPVVATMKPHVFYPKNYSAEKTLDLFKQLFSQNEISIERIFVDQTIKDDLCKLSLQKQETEMLESQLTHRIFENVQHVHGHGDHFHVRIKCSKLDPSCRSRIYKKMNACTTK